MGLIGLTDSQNYSDIADAIRLKAGTSSSYLPSEMALAIRQISGGGAVILQDKTANPSTAIQTVQYDTGYDGLRKVTINAIPSDYVVPTGTKQITQNGISDVAAYKSVNVAVPTGGGTATVTSLDITPTELTQIYTASTSNVDGFTPVTVAAISSKYVGSGVPRRDWGTITPGIANQTLQSGYLEENATVLGDLDLVPGNIKKDVQIFGVTGTYEAGSPNLQEKTASSSTAKQTITPDSGYDGLSKVTINGMTTGSATTPTKTISVTPSISVNSSNGQISVSVSGSSAITPTVSAGYVSQGTSGTVSVTGSNSQTMATKAAATITPGTATQTIAANQFLTGAQTIQGDANLVAGNIKKDTSIFGVTGTYEGSGGGATNVITGTFTTNSTAGVQSVSLPYTGTGYIIDAHVYVDGGPYNTANAFYSATNRYQIAQWVMAKANNIAPTFTTSGSANYGCTAWVYKNSASAPTSYSRSSAMTTNTFSSSTATNAGATCVRFNTSTNMRCYISASATYGLASNTKYHYQITYSS